MINTIPPGDQKRTHIIGRSQGYLGLAVNFGTIINEATGKEFPCLTTAYKATPDELSRLNDGATVNMQLLYVTPDTDFYVMIGDQSVNLSPVVVFDTTANQDARALTGSHQPTTDELRRLNADESIVIRIVGAMQHPPIAVYA